MRTKSLLLAASAAISLSVALLAQTPPAAPAAATPSAAPAAKKSPVKPALIEKVYELNCAPCHGLNLEGGAGLSLLGPEWKHGGDSESLFKTIKGGIPDTAMPPWAALGDDKIRALVVFIREYAYVANLAKHPVKATPADGNYKSEEHNFIVETFAKDLETPWSMTWLPDGRMLVTERAGRLRFIEKDGKVSEPIKGVPAVFYAGQAGMFEVAAHPDYAKNGWLYLSFSDIQKVDGKDVSQTKIVRGHIRDGQWVDEQTIFKAPLKFYGTSNIQYGGRMVFDKGYLFFSTGDRGGKGELAQDLTGPSGKIHRIFDDGRVPTDNPFSGRSDVYPTIWSYGHRNPQGLVRHPVTGELWETEHGPRGGDELNVIKPGQNYGWPLVTYGMNYDGSPWSSNTTLPGMVDPVIYWTPSIATCGLDVYTGDKFPKWKNNLFAGGLGKEEVDRIVVQDGKVTHKEIIFQKHGRVRDICMGPDGLIYIVLNTKPEEKGSIVRLRPE